MLMSLLAEGSQIFVETRLGAAQRLQHADTDLREPPGWAIERIRQRTAERAIDGPAPMMVRFMSGGEKRHGERGGCRVDRSANAGG
ncbi:hypothetical protein HDG34_007270 [Paraburkholderia sp. HC6.4b]|nr:hypothetical protein [Paraburkholderia sp. HC6.4b]MBB5455573.1 hypothetical protein [Paraburkholderia sp. Kb1A]